MYTFQFSALAVIFADVKFSVLEFVMQYIYGGEICVPDSLIGDFTAAVDKFKLIGFGRNDDDAGHPTVQVTAIGAGDLSSKLPKPLRRRMKRARATRSKYHSSDADDEDGAEFSHRPQKMPKGEAGM